MKYQLHNRTLRFDKFSLSLRGNYKCIAENKYGIKGNSSVEYGIVHGVFSLTAPQDCIHYDHYFRHISVNRTGVIPMSCKSQYGCSVC